MERGWEEENSRFRSLQREWRKLDDKRRRVSEKMAQLSLVARTSALLGGFQVAMYINQGMPGLQDVWAQPAAASHDGQAEASVWRDNPHLHDAMLTVWAVTCVSSILLNMCILIMAGLMQLSVVRRTYPEPNFNVNDTVRYSADPVHGVIATQEDFLHFWRAACDRKFVRLLRAFSWGIPLYFASLALAVVIKFYMSAWAACLAVVPTLLGTKVWWHYHCVLLSYIIHRSEDRGPYAGGGGVVLMNEIFENVDDIVGEAGGCTETSPALSALTSTLASPPVSTHALPNPLQSLPPSPKSPNHPRATAATAPEDINAGEPAKTPPGLSAQGLRAAGRKAVSAKTVGTPQPREPGPWPWRTAGNVNDNSHVHGMGISDGVWEVDDTGREDEARDCMREAGLKSITFASLP